LSAFAVDRYQFDSAPRIDDGFADEVVVLWNESIGPTFPLRLSLLRACLEPTGRWVSVIGVRADGDLVGFGYATHRVGDVPRLQAVVVSPDHRHHGIGRGIASRLLQACAGREATAVEIGAGTGYLWPGVPEDLPDAPAFTLAIGFSPGLPTYDLRGDISSLPAFPARGRGSDQELLAFRPSRLEDIDEVGRFVEAEFDPDWAMDLRAFLAAGGRPTDIYVVRDHSGILGFARLHFPDSSPIGPPLYWADRRSPTAGGLGPIGVSSARRGQGLGTALLRSALLHLRAGGSTDIVIDMTHLLGFYGQFGFVPWLRFRQASLDPTGPNR
jgi:GNAT superfamily N-acetyltransferase